MIEFTAKGAAESTIINRREILPLLARARGIAESYEKATGCRTLVLDRSGFSGLKPREKIPYPLCGYCVKYRSGFSADSVPCAALHAKALAEAHRGDSPVYTCEIGFGFWASPLLSGGRYAGALAAGRVLTVPNEEATEKFISLSGGRAGKKFSDEYARVPVKTQEEIRAMVRILIICAKKISEEYSNLSFMRQSTLAEEETAEANRETPKDAEAGRVFPEGERILLAALYRGDKNAAEGILDKLLETTGKSAPSDFEALRLKAAELAVILSRAADETLNLEAAHSRCFRRLRESANVEELKANLRCIVDRTGAKIFRFQGIRHASAIRRAERFIWKNYTHKLSLNEIAKASGLSAPYFSTIFREEMGENLSSYLNRLRVEKAACLLTETVHSLSEIAGECGFEDQSWFSKIFKSRMGLSPGKFREQGRVDKNGAAYNP